MSVLIEHQTTLACDDEHRLIPHGEVVNTVYDEDERPTRVVVGFYKYCMDCGTILEFRTDRDYPA